mgnify:CR=1 FL=1
MRTMLFFVFIALITFLLLPIVFAGIIWLGDNIYGPYFMFVVKLFRL